MRLSRRKVKSNFLEICQLNLTQTLEGILKVNLGRLSRQGHRSGRRRRAMGSTVAGSDAHDALPATAAGLAAGTADGTAAQSGLSRVGTSVAPHCATLRHTQRYRRRRLQRRRCPGGSSCGHGLRSGSTLIPRRQRSRRRQTEVQCLLPLVILRRSFRAVPAVSGAHDSRSQRDLLSCRAFKQG